MESSPSPKRTTLWMGLLVVAVVTTGAALFMVWLFLGGGAWRSEVSVVRAMLHSETSLTLMVGACNRAPSVSLLKEIDDYVEVEVVAYSTLLGDELHCLEEVKVYLEDALGDRPLIDRHSGRTVSIITFENSRTKGGEH